MKFINRYILIALMLVFGASACEEGLDPNIDPNSAASVPASNLVTNAIFQISDDYWGRGMSFEFGSLMVQHLAQAEYTSDQNYIFTDADFDGRWSGYYNNMMDLVVARQFVEAAELSDAQRANQFAIIDILYAFAFQTATDNWGDMPYTEAFNSAEFDKPAYDSQQTIYNALIQKVGTAVNSIDTGAPGFASGDILFNGNMAAWEQFGHGLLLRLGMRIVNPDATQAQSVVTTALGNITANSFNNVDFVFDGASNDLSNPYFRDNITRDDFRLTEMLVDGMKASNDPRLAIYGVHAPGQGDYVGMPYGIDDNAATQRKGATSDINPNIEDNAVAPAYLMSAAEVEFFRAEAIARGWVAGGPAGAEAAWRDGIRASMNQWGVAAADRDAYVAAATYDATSLTTQLNAIAQEKWLALFANGVEAYAEQRRLGQPALSPGVAAQTSFIPTRMLYPVSEGATNKANMDAAHGGAGNLLNVPMWWQ